MFLWLKRLSGSMSDGQWFSGRPEVSALDLERDWPEMERLIRADQLSHAKQDVAGWLAQDGAVALVAHKDGKFAGFFVAHPVGTVAHVDLVSVDPGFRKSSIARPLYFRGVNELKVRGATGFVAHAGAEAGHLLQLLGYTAGSTFVLMRSQVGEMTVAGGHRGELVDEHEMTVDEIVGLDKTVFGADRAGFIQHLFDREDTEVYGFRKKGELIACLVFQRLGDTLLIRLAEGREFRDISSLVHVAMVMNSGRNLECVVRKGGKLATMFESLDFSTPQSFQPLTEYRLGETAGIGDGDGVLQLSWW